MTAAIKRQCASTCCGARGHPELREALRDRAVVLLKLAIGLERPDPGA
jgi:hypothetical protein